MVEWVIMPGMENFLPKEYQFETELKDVRDFVDDELDEVLARQHEDIIDYDKELSRPMAQLWSLSTVLAEMYGEPNENNDGVRAAMYRGASFGLQLVEYIKDAPIETISTDYWDATLQKSDPALELLHDVYEYYDQRPNLKGIVFTFLPYIDDTDEYLYNDHAKLAAGLMLMMCENEQAEAYLQAQDELLPKELG